MTYDRELTLSAAGSRKAALWAQTRTLWSELCQRLRTPLRGEESRTAYLRMPKGRQDELKDVGGFVGGALRGGRRKAGSVLGRDLVTLDLDAIPAGGTQAVLEAVERLQCAACVYSTRKHAPEAPRLRVLIPLSRTVSAEEYEPIARRIGERLGIAQCDPTTFQAVRMMYWPSCCADGEYVYEVFDAPLLSADSVLASYRDWRNVAEWPQVPGGREAHAPGAHQEDPTQKAGLIGAFCRCYDIYQAMDEFLPGVYLPTDEPDRYTYSGGSTAGGALVYEGKWLYSHHATDPAGGRLCNAWDLVRLHLYGDKDEDAAPGTPVGRLPSYAAMRERAAQLPSVRREMREEVVEEFRRAAGESPDQQGTGGDDGWKNALKTDGHGRIMRSLARGPLPWNPDPSTRDWADEDDTGAAWYLEKEYGVQDLRRIKMSVDAAMAAQQVDTLTEYLDGLTWDGVPRVDTLLIRYLKADDTPYTRAVTRKTLAAAVARAYEPGCKFDSVLTLVGAQGIAKSLFASTLGRDWFSDNIQTFTGKEAAEQLRGIWIVEIPEVDRFSARYEAAAVKQFITRQDDIYREAYGRRTLPHPRRCIFIATTNAPSFLTDKSGNRRWWIVPCHATAQDRGEDMASLRRDRDQVWAEAVALWQLGEPLTLSRDIALEAVRQQREAQEDDPWAGAIAEFAERKVPPDWGVRSPRDRLTWWADEFGQRTAGELTERRTICAVEVWCELLGGQAKALDRRTAQRINDVLRALEGWRPGGVQRTPYGGQRCFVKDVLSPIWQGRSSTLSTLQTSSTL